MVWKCTQTKPHQQPAHKWILIIYRLYMHRQIAPSLPGCGAGSTSSHSPLSKGANRTNRGNGEEGNLLVPPHKGRSKKSKGLFTVLQSPSLPDGPLELLGGAQLRAVLRLPRAGISPQQEGTRGLCQVPPIQDHTLWGAHDLIFPGRWH